MKRPPTIPASSLAVTGRTLARPSRTRTFPAGIALLVLSLTPGDRLVRSFRPPAPPRPSRTASLRPSVPPPVLRRPPSALRSLCDEPTVRGRDDLTRRQILALWSGVAVGLGVRAPPFASASDPPAVSQAWDEISILRPPGDLNTYSYHTFPNGLQLALVLDPSPSSSCAACVSVRVGATSDPATVKGLAHFCEHMLFLGTDKYPKEDEFSTFLSAHGGSSNAYTDSESTVYYCTFNSSNDSSVVGEALERFGAFFSGASLSQSSTNRELNAIDSEHSKNLQQDGFRNYQLEKAIRGNPAHPYNKFFTGNKKTLLEDTKAQNMDLRKELVKFYETYYSANLMTATVVLPQSLFGDKSKALPLLDKAFQDVPNRRAFPPEVSWEGTPPFTPIQNLFVLEAVPVRELRQVTISFPIETTTYKEQTTTLSIKAESYISHLVGHEGKGSILSCLKKKGWANVVSAGQGTDLSDFYTLDVNVDLTATGLNHVDEVIATIFSYLNMLRKQNIPDYVFDELLQTSELSAWRFLPKESTERLATEMAPNMWKYRDVGPQYVLAGPRRLDVQEDMTEAYRAKFRPGGREDARQEVQNLMQKLVPLNAQITVFSKTFQGRTNAKEAVYGTDYLIRPVDDRTLLSWTKPLDAARAGLAYPRRNFFIPSERGLAFKGPIPSPLPLRPLELEERMTPPSPPVKIRDDDRWTVRFKQDDNFGQPRAYLIFELLSNAVYRSPRDATLAQLYEVSVQDALNEYAYDASLAGLSYDLKVLPRGVRLTFGGYDEKLGEWAGYIGRKLARDVRSVLPASKQEFERYRDGIRRAQAGFDVKQPYAHAIYFANLLLVPRPFDFPVEELKKALQDVTLQDLDEYAGRLWRRGRGEALIQGNLRKEEALKVVDAVDKALNFEAAGEEEYPARVRATRFPRAQQYSLVRTVEPNPENSNAACQIVIQCDGTGEKNHVLIEVISAIIEEPYYEDLRTQKQLGYIVSSGVKVIEETRNLNLIVQSSVAPAEKLTMETLKFLDSFRARYLSRLTEVDVARYVKGIVERKTDPDKNLVTEVTRNWGEMAAGRKTFDRLQREAAALLDVGKEDVLNFWDKYMDPGAPGGRRLLVSEVVPQVGVAASTVPPRSFEGGGEGQQNYGGDVAVKLGADDVEKFRRERSQISS